MIRTEKLTETREVVIGSVAFVACDACKKEIEGARTGEGQSLGAWRLPEGWWYRLEGGPNQDRAAMCPDCGNRAAGL